MKIDNNKSNIETLTPTIFHEDWWLDIASGGNYGVSEYIEDGKIVARLPYYRDVKFGLSFIKGAPLTNFLGPAIDDGEGKSNKKFLRRLKVTEELIKQLPQTNSVYIKCHRDVFDAVAFQAAGFDVSVQFTNEIEPAPIEELWSGMRAKVRSSIRGAKKEYIVENSEDSASFLMFYEQNIRNKELENNLNNNVCGKLIDASIKKGQGRIIQSVHNQTGNIDAAIFYVWDNVSAYFLLTTHNPAASHRGVLKVLIWEAIQDAVSRGLIFDFDGISSTGCARSANDFTATLVPRYIIKRSSLTIQILRVIRSLFYKPNTFY